MHTLRYLTDPTLRELYRPAVVAALAVAAICAPLSLLVVLKRLAFIGQGISHAALGGVGLAVALGFGAAGASAAGSAGAASGSLSAPLAALLQGAIIFTFCLAAGLVMGLLADRGKEDTAIGVVLVVTMSLGAVLLHKFGSRVSWESFLFGSVTDVSWTDASLAWLCAAIVVCALWWWRRPLLFWAFDEPVARAAGVRARAMRFLLMALLTLATVVTMKLAGVVLATALLVLPGATALRLSATLRTVSILTALFALMGVVGGLVVAFELAWLPGASIVLVLALLYAAARTLEAITPTPRAAPTNPPS